MSFWHYVDQFFRTGAYATCLYTRNVIGPDMADKICSSCGVRLQGRANTTFKCPKCGKEEIGRCAQCRDQGVKYECKSCGFVGP